jgi:CheY-like chemotaxis protein
VASTILPRPNVSDDDLVGSFVPTDVRVLVVDDQALFRRAMVAVVGETDGFRVVGAVTSGEESLTAAHELLPDLILMDVNLPGIDGVEAARRLTGGPDGPVVILLSTYADDEFDLDGSGAASYVAKGAFGSDRLVQAWAAATS